MRTETDDKLMLAVRDERPDAMGVLFERHQQRMYRFFRRSVSDRASCEDLVQSLFVRMLEYRASYRGGASYLGWMYRIAINVRNDWLRRHRREKASYVLEPNDEASTFIAGSSAGEHARLRAAFDALRPVERDVLLLTRFEGLPYEEAAEVLNCSVGAPALHGLRAYGSFGVLGGHSAAILFYPDHGLAWIALSNVAEGALPPPGLMERFFRRQERPAPN